MRRCLLIGLLWYSLSSLAAEPVEMPPEFLTCSRIQQNGERLACYDRAVAYLQRGGEHVPAPSAESSFGLQTNVTESRAEKAGSEQSEAALSSVTANVSDVSSMRDGLRIALDNGQTWRQITGSTAFAPKAGDQVTIRRGAFGSFLMDVPNGPALRVRRIK
ncbi:hypothetical protein GCM10011487_09960 [Steroidobacter agaridevorans]|uniref:Type IV pilus biogenesis protein PilP n=1 Tax=Steroidobacter agaridevorans TaxID=2695856 RepID=A0A829Y879_9GAMM|nr:hypothetical protein [Steroidobacter agaridevorans]GFE78996.1 hypothetical protein GCM10011487_09960 [Steroidobacter agaridevorans]GFE88151.1 hypothetical protein GCM10011488_31050 [Steroidobacter agaridevorans]